MIRITTIAPAKSYHINDLEPGDIVSQSYTYAYIEYFLIIYNRQQKVALYLGNNTGTPGFTISERQTFTQIVGKMENVKE